MRPAFQVFCSYTSRTVKRSRKMTKAAGSKKSSEDVLMNGHRSVNVNSKPSKRKGSFHGICKPEHEYRIVPVSRTKGGKDRHSKVRTFRGLRDRRIRLSVDTAIQFYDLQDRLGVEHPSMAVDWLITAAKDAIDKLPELGELASGSQITFSVGCLEERDNGYSATTNATSAPQDEHSKIQDGKVKEGKSTSSGSEGSVKASGADSTTTSKASRAKARQKARERTRRKTASAESKSVQLHQVLNELSSVQHSYSALIKNVAPLRLMKPVSHEGVQNHSFQHLLENVLPSYQDVICSNDTSNVVHQSASLCSSAFSRPLLSDSFTLPYDFRQVYEMEDFNIHVSDQKQRPTGRIESLPIHPNIHSPKLPKNIEKETEQKYQYRSLLSAFSDTEMNVSYLGNRGPLQSNSDSASLISLDQKSSCQDDGMPTSEGVCLQSYGPCYRQ